MLTPTLLMALLPAAAHDTPDRCADWTRRAVEAGSWSDAPFGWVNVDCTTVDDDSMRTWSVCRSEPIRAEDVARRLPPRSAALAYMVIRDGGTDEEPASHVRANYVGCDGVEHRVEIGSVADVARACDRWIESVRSTASSSIAADEPERGEVLRSILVDPVFQQFQDVDQVFVASGAVDIPLAALPLGADRIIDRWSITWPKSYDRPTVAESRPASTPELVTVGDLDYDATEVTDEQWLGYVSSRTEPSRDFKFEAIPNVRAELDGVEALFGRSFHHRPIRVDGARSMVDAVDLALRRATFAHVVTWHYEYEELQALPRFELPRMICGGWTCLSDSGLAVAGANLGADLLKRAPGLQNFGLANLMFEDEAGSVFSHCDLAFFDTSRADRFCSRTTTTDECVAHWALALGARTVIAPRWNVDRECAVELVNEFYRRLWNLHESKSAALRNSVAKLRSEHFPIKDWAAWSLWGASE